NVRGRQGAGKDVGQLRLPRLAVFSNSLLLPSDGERHVKDSPIGEAILKSLSRGIELVIWEEVSAAKVRIGPSLRDGRADLGLLCVGQPGHGRGVITLHQQPSSMGPGKGPEARVAPLHQLLDVEVDGWETRKCLDCPRGGGTKSSSDPSSHDGL